jgi:hypothetical protein
VQVKTCNIFLTQGPGNPKNHQGIVPGSFSSVKIRS